MAKITLFSTNIWHKHLAAPSVTKRLNRELMRDIQTLEDMDEDGRAWSQENYHSGYTSYGSITSLHENFAPFMELRKLIDGHAKKYFKLLNTALTSPPEMQSCWVNVMPTGSTHSLHLHPMSVISGTYYVETPKGSGSLKFEDPRLSGMMMAPPKEPFFKITPKAGDLVLFPSWLRHEVETNRGRHPRVSVSFNY